MLPTRRIIGGNPMLGYVCDSLLSNSIYHQIVRWRGKPKWLPMAKSKVFRIPVRKHVPKDEELEVLKLFNVYRTSMASIRKYCITQVEKSQISLDEAYLQKLEDEDFDRCMAINDEWNKKLATERDERRKIEKDKLAVQIMENMEKIDRKLQERRDLMDAKIRKAKEESKTFITEKNIDEAIEQALSQTTNYDKVLDLEGSFYEVKASENLPKISQTQ